MNKKQHFRLLEKLAGQNNTYPVVTSRYGYSDFIAYVFKLEKENKPSEWWVGELAKDHTITSIKRICNY